MKLHHDGYEFHERNQKQYRYVGTIDITPRAVHWTADISLKHILSSRQSVSLFYRLNNNQLTKILTRSIGFAYESKLSKSGKFDIVITEIGGTVGDIESLPFIEAVRQIQWELPDDDVVVIHLTLIPYLRAAKELKTKPTQHSVKMLSQEGVHPDILVCRTERPLMPELRRKIALFCNVKLEAVIEAADAPTIYEVPLLMMREKLDIICMKKLNIVNNNEPDLSKWKEFLDKLKYPKSKVTIGLIGKYLELQDAYKSILESFIHAGAMNECQVQIINIHSEFITDDNVYEKLAGLDGLLVAPGFGHRGVEGKIVAVKYARENGLPFFGICLGMQMAAIEFARNVLGLKDAHSTEMDPETKEPVIDLMEEQKKVTAKGGTMRLGSYPCEIKEGTLAHRIYGKTLISERHRHRRSRHHLHSECRGLY